MFIIAPDERHLVVKNDINTTKDRIGLHSENLGKRIEISAFDKAAESLVSNDSTSNNTGIY